MERRGFRSFLQGSQKLDTCPTTNPISTSSTLTLPKFENFSMDFDEDEAPPLLVEVESNQDESITEKEPKPIRVPITIVTGT